MEIITRSFTTVHGEPASTWHVRHHEDSELITAGQITRTDNGYVVDRHMGRRYTYRTAARAAQAMREHIAERWPDELSATAAKESPAHEVMALAKAESALDQLRKSPEMAAMVQTLMDIQRRTESILEMMMTLDPHELKDYVERMGSETTMAPAMMEPDRKAS